MQIDDPQIKHLKRFLESPAAMDLPVDSKYSTTAMRGLMSVTLSLALGVGSLLACSSNEDPSGSTGGRDAGSIPAPRDTGAGVPDATGSDTGIQVDLGVMEEDAGPTDAQEDAGTGGEDAGPRLCGNGEVDPEEECDEGENNGRLRCGEDCRWRYAASCVACEDAQCVNGDGVSLAEGCFGLRGTASAGDGRGRPLSELCAEMYLCIRRTRCDFLDRGQLGVFEPGIDRDLLPCYCGDVAPLDCLDPTVPVNGPCQQEFEAATEYVPDLGNPLDRGQNIFNFLECFEPAAGCGAGNLTNCSMFLCSEECGYTF